MLVNIDWIPIVFLLAVICTVVVLGFAIEFRVRRSDAELGEALDQLRSKERQYDYLRDEYMRLLSNSLGTQMIYPSITTTVSAPAPISDNLMGPEKDFLPGK